jgi:radical SAM protein with 4Fe4S-binding SPASM domain
MIDVSLLYCGFRPDSAPHRYGQPADDSRGQPMQLQRSARDRRPVVVWNVTRTCNLRCMHCYSDSAARAYAGELDTAQAKVVIDDLADFHVPAVLFSGGEPLTRPDLFDLAAYARTKNLRTVLSTNATLIDEPTAQRIRAAGFSYVGVSLDGARPEVHDHFRGRAGAFHQAIRGLRNLVQVGQKVGLRLTLSRPTFEGLAAVFDLIRHERINRACFYHLVPAGRGQGVLDLSPAESRRAIDLILQQTRQLHDEGRRVEVLTVDNHCDGPYLYLKMLAENDPRAPQVYDLLRWNGGALYSSGVGIACMDWSGQVHPDQFWLHHSLGDVRQRPFSQIWTHGADPLLAGLRNRKGLLKGRCARCRFLDLCGGALRVRAELLTGDPWAADPACYLNDEEIGLSQQDTEGPNASSRHSAPGPAATPAGPAKAPSG